MDKLLTTCAALGANGGFCAGSLDATIGVPGEARLCSAGLHRFISDGEGWTLDVTWEPHPTVVDLGDVDLGDLEESASALAVEPQPASPAGAGRGAASARSSWTT